MTRKLFELSPQETQEYVNMINEGKIKPGPNQTYLERFLEMKQEDKIR